MDGLPFTTEENQQARETTKSDLVAAPNIHTHLDYTGLGSRDTHCFFSTGLSCTKKVFEKAHTLKIIPPRQGNKRSVVFQCRYTTIPKSYCTTGQSDPLKATMVT